MEVAKPNPDKLRVFYDGLCIVCATEIDLYRRRDQGKALELIDISLPDFNPAAYGLEGRDIQKNLHATLPDGTVIEGVETFIEIWKRVPGWRWAARFAQKAAPRSVLEKGYAIFTRIRPYLPRRQHVECATDRCNVR